MTDDEEATKAKSDIEEARPPHPGSDNSHISPKIGTNAKTLEKLRKVEAEKVIVLSFRSLQLQRIAVLQDELLGLALEYGRAGEKRAGLDVEIDKALGKYADALRNYETLSLNAQPVIPTGARLVGQLAPDGFVAVAEPKRGGLRGLVKNSLEALLNFLAPHIRPLASTVAIWKDARSILERSGIIRPSELLTLLEQVAGNLGFRELDQRGRELRVRHRAFTQRMVMAIFGGAALIGPMLIMTLHPSRNTSLITVSVATFLFALVLAIIANDSSGKDVLGATAAYAAVLVVFVGTSTTPNA